MLLFLESITHLQSIKGVKSIIHIVYHIPTEKIIFVTLSIFVLFQFCIYFFDILDT